MMGAFDSDNDMLDRPDLNKCPDCGCFFAQDNCPLCGKPCPEEMRAGNRAAPKKQKYKYDNGYRTVQFVDWYHRWWFIVIMAFISPLISLVLLITSPHKKAHKIIAAAVAVLYMIVSHFVLPLLLSHYFFKPDLPVDTSLSKEEYIAKCEALSAEEFYRNPEKYDGKFVKLELVVTKNVTSLDYYEPTCYICKSADGGEFEIIVYSYLLDGDQNLLPGDKITVYGEGAGTGSVYDNSGALCRATCVNMAYMILSSKQIENSAFPFGTCCFFALHKKLAFTSKMNEYSKNNWISPC